MTPTVEIQSSAGLKQGADASVPKPRAAAAGQTAFELMLNLQMISKMPEMPGSDRLKEHAQAQDERDSQRTQRASAQQPPRQNAARPSTSNVAGPRAATQSGAGAPAGAASSGNSTVTSTAEGSSGTKDGSTSTLTAKPAEVATPAAESGTKSSPGANNADASGPRHGQGGAFGALLSNPTSARVASEAGRATSSVLSVKAVSPGSSGSSGVAQHGWSAGRGNGRSAAARSRSNAPAHQPRSFQFEQQKVLAQVGRGLAAALKREGGVVTLRLQPQTLGELKIKLELSQGRVEATFRAENDAARQLLESSLDALRSSLEAKGLRVDRLHVLTPDDPGHKQQSGSPGEPNDREQTPGGDREARDDGDRQRQSPGMADQGAGLRPPTDAEASVEQVAVSDARIAEDSTHTSGLSPGEDEMLVRVRLDAVA
jgi:flagellar hook-length control protein FliK